MRAWLCIDERSSGEQAIWGAVLDEPFPVENCWFGGWQNHYTECGWYELVETRNKGETE